jgi:hypothetical protein
MGVRNSDSRFEPSLKVWKVRYVFLPIFLAIEVLYFGSVSSHDDAIAALSPFRMKLWRHRMIDLSVHSHLTDYYLQKKIHPQQFNCPHQLFCRSFAYQNKMTETKMSMVGSRYGCEYPKIVVVSLDPPYGDQGDFTTPHQRFTEYVAAKSEADDYALNRPNTHWAATQIIVKDLLCLFGYQAQLGAAVATEKYAGRPIENVSAYFAHVNVAKCSMNNLGKAQAHRKVHKICGDSYLKAELAILEPDILVSQGKATNSIMADLFGAGYFQEADLPAVKKVQVGNKTALWLLMRHPTRQLKKIGNDWASYVAAVQAWRGITSVSVA